MNNMFIPFFGAANQIRTGDLFLTKEVLCLLSHSSIGRGRRDRTLGTRFWRPLLYLLSYTPIWWAFTGSNRGPTGYEPAALTN